MPARPSSAGPRNVPGPSHGHTGTAAAQGTAPTGAPDSSGSRGTAEGLPLPDGPGGPSCSLCGSPHPDGHDCSEHLCYEPATDEAHDAWWCEIPGCPFLQVG